MMKNISRRKFHVCLSLHASLPLLQSLIFHSIVLVRQQIFLEIISAITKRKKCQSTQLKPRRRKTHFYHIFFFNLDFFSLIIWSASVSFPQIKKNNNANLYRVLIRYQRPRPSTTDGAWHDPMNKTWLTAFARVFEKFLHTYWSDCASGRVSRLCLNLLLLRCLPTSQRNFFFKQEI